LVETEFYDAVASIRACLLLMLYRSGIDM